MAVYESFGLECRLSAVHIKTQVLYMTIYNNDITVNQKRMGGDSNIRYFEKLLQNISDFLNLIDFSFFM